MKRVFDLPPGKDFLHGARQKHQVVAQGILDQVVAGAALQSDRGNLLLAGVGQEDDGSRPEFPQEIESSPVLETVLQERDIVDVVFEATDGVFGAGHGIQLVSRDVTANELLEADLLGNVILNEK